MAKRILIKPILSIEGKPLKRVVQDDEGQPVFDDAGKMKLADSNTADVLDSLIRLFPRERMTMENITEGVRLKTQITEAQKSKDGILTLDDSTHKWVEKMLKDEAVGPKIFGFNLIAIIEAIDDFERLHESKEKEGVKIKKDEGTVNE